MEYVLNESRKDQKLILKTNKTLCMDKSFIDTRSGGTTKSPLRSYDKAWKFVAKDASRKMIKLEVAGILACLIGEDNDCVR